MSNKMLPKVLGLQREVLTLVQIIQNKVHSTCSAYRAGDGVGETLVSLSLTHTPIRGHSE